MSVCHAGIAGGVIPVSVAVSMSVSGYLCQSGVGDGVCVYNFTLFNRNVIVLLSVTGASIFSIRVCVDMNTAIDIGMNVTIIVGVCVGSSDVNRKPKIWYTKKIPIPNRYLVFLSQISWYFLGILSVF